MRKPALYNGTNNYSVIYFLICVLLFFFCYPSYAQKNGGITPGKHLLWAVHSGKNTVYLLGSIHVLKKDAYPLPDTIERIYGCCSKVVFETDLDGMNDPASQNKMKRLGSYPTGQTLSKNISTQTYELLKKRMAAANVQLERLEPFRPWFVALAITALEIQRLGYDPELGIDRYFFKKAKRDGKKMIFLETNERQLNLMARMNKTQQEMFLRETLKELDIIETMSADMVKAWETGDADRLNLIIKKGFDEHPDIYKRFFTQRNKNWLPQIQRLLKQDGDVLVIVGAGHLVGEQSLIDLLEKKGYKVQQL
jgi:uncharacterized protein YbaP (TraB family)